MWTVQRWWPASGERLARGSAQTTMIVGVDQAAARQATLDQLGEQRGPARLELPGPDMDDEGSTKAVRANAVTG